MGGSCQKTIQECEAIDKQIQELIENSTDVSYLKNIMTEGGFKTGDVLYFSIVFVKIPIYSGEYDIYWKGEVSSDYDGSVKIYKEPGVFIVDEFTRAHYQQIINEFDFYKDYFSKRKGHVICSSSQENLKIFLNELDFATTGNINIKRGETILNLSSSIVDVKVKKAFFEDVNYRDRLEPNTPLHRAAEDGDLDEVVRLIKKGANV